MRSIRNVFRGKLPHLGACLSPLTHSDRTEPKLGCPVDEQDSIGKLLGTRNGMSAGHWTSDIGHRTWAYIGIYGQSSSSHMTGFFFLFSSFLHSMFLTASRPQQWEILNTKKCESSPAYSSHCNTFLNLTYGCSLTTKKNAHVGIVCVGSVRQVQQLCWWGWIGGVQTRLVVRDTWSCCACLTLLTFLWLDKPPTPPHNPHPLFYTPPPLSCRLLLHS